MQALNLRPGDEIMIDVPARVRITNVEELPGSPERGNLRISYEILLTLHQGTERTSFIGSLVDVRLIAGATKHYTYDELGRHLGIRENYNEGDLLAALGAHLEDPHGFARGAWKTTEELVALHDRQHATPEELDHAGVTARYAANEAAESAGR